jgi:hypothetical protein
MYRDDASGRPPLLVFSRNARVCKHTGCTCHIFSQWTRARDIISDDSRKASKKYRGSAPRQRREASTHRALAATPFQEARTHFAETLYLAPRRSSPHTSSPLIALESWVTSPRSTTTVRPPDGKSSGIFAREKYLAASRNFAVASAVASDPPPPSPTVLRTRSGRDILVVHSARSFARVSGLDAPARRAAPRIPVSSFSDTFC